jgi:hypothetical protein
LGELGDEEAHSIALDSLGNVYVAGYTASSNYPTTFGAYDTKCGTNETETETETCNSNDVFVSKLSNDLSNLLASTFIGGSDPEVAYSIALDSSGNV